MNSKPKSYSILYVDLDGTLLQTDSLWEQLIVLCKTPWHVFGALFMLLRGKTHCKAYCLRHSGIPEISTLPKNEQVIRIINEHHALGIPVILATASLQEIALSVKHEIKAISGIIASTIDDNLKGEDKARAILEHSEGKTFAYIGNDHSDFHVWKHADGIFYVGSSPSITKRLLIDYDHVTIIPTEKQSSVSTFIRQIRLYQWIKNALVFLPAFLAHSITFNAIIPLSLTFLVFGLLASSVYVLNDLLDLQSDRLHPRKKERPLASGAISIPNGIVICIFLLTIALLIGFFFLPINVLYVLLAYSVVTTFYSLYGKKVAILDVMLLAGLYTLRLIAGAETVQVPLSEWLMGFSMFFFVSLAFVKRYSEILSRKESLNQLPGRGYGVGDESILLTAGLASAMLSILVLALYINSEAVIRLYKHPNYLWVLCPAILTWLLQLWFLAHRGKMHDDPIITMARTPMTYVVLCIIVSTIIIATV